MQLDVAQTLDNVRGLQAIEQGTEAMSDNVITPIDHTIRSIEQVQIVGHLS